METAQPMSLPATSDPVAPVIRMLRFVFLAAFAITITSAVIAAGGPENALIVVNADSWASTCIANEYIAARKIPPTNVVYLRNLPEFERMGVDDFRAKILLPAFQHAEQQRISGQIDYVIYSADFPTAIDVSADIAGKKLPQVITQPASINGLTFLYALTLSKNVNYLSLSSNFYLRQIARTLPDGEWSEEDKRHYADALGALQRTGATTHAEPEPPKDSATPPKVIDLKTARDLLVALKAHHTKNTELLYNLACAYARLGDGDSAVGALRDAIDNGWWDMRLAEQDPDFAGVKGRVDFGLLVARAKLVKFELIPTSGFRGGVGWLPSGQPVPPAQGMRYMLSTVLACTSGRGNSVTEALASLRRSIAADGSHPKGTIYFLENHDVRSTAREWGFRRAAEKLREIGVWASVEHGEVPKNKPDVAGATIGTAGFDWAASGSTIAPGAICEHLTSFGGAMSEGDGQTPLTDFIRAGAAGASGTVTEPYAVQAKFPTPFIHWHYAQGCTLAEAFYQSIAGPYQLLIVGDALCSPWKKRFAVRAEGLAPGSVLKGVARISASATSEDEIAPAGFEVFLDGRRVAVNVPGKVLEFDTTGAPDGPHDLVVASSGTNPIASRATLHIPVVIRNGSGKFRVTAPSGEWAWDKPLKFSADAPGAKSIVFLQNFREVARIAGASGSVELDPRALGQGPVRIQPVAVLSDTAELLAEPIALRIKPPAALPASSASAKLNFANGFKVTPRDGAATILEESTGDWLAKAGVAKDGDYAIDGWFSVPANDVYQFQLRGPAKLRVLVDGQPQSWPRGSEWWFVPVHLAKGRHRLQIECKADGAPRLDVRFGGPGTRHLDGAHFQHPAPAK